ncbi:MAG: hypothetical protein ABIJ56_02745 [Pseudomonadota bacterium]
MNSLLQKLVDTFFECDNPGVAGKLTIVSDLNTVSFGVEDGYLLDSSLKGPGQTFFDFLLTTGRLGHQACQQVLHLARQENITPYEALLKGGMISIENLTLSRYQLAAQRLSLFLGTNFKDISFKSYKHSGALEHPGAQRAVLLLLEYLRIAYDAGILKPTQAAPYALVRPTDRMKRYIGSLRSIIPGELPLPVVGGETYDSLESKYGAGAAAALSLLFLTGMLKVEMEDYASTSGADIKLDRLFQLVKQMILLSAREVADDSGADFQLALETGNLLLEGFSAFEPSLAYYEKISQVVHEEDIATERKLLLSFLAGRSDTLTRETLPMKISSLPAGRDTKSALLRFLSIHYFFKGKMQEAARCLHEAFIYKPYDFENLALFIQFFTRDPSIALEAESDRGLEIESFREGEYPEVLPLAIRCARENRQFELISWIMKEAIEKVHISSQVFDLITEIIRNLGWGPDLIEFITHFSLTSDRKGWTNPLWSLGALYSAEKIEGTMNFAREAYEVLIKTSSGKGWALTKLIDIMEKISQPNMMLDLLEKSFKDVTTARQRVEIGNKLATLLVDEFGELKEAGHIAAQVIELEPENETAVKIVLQALAEGKLSRSSCLRFIKSIRNTPARPESSRRFWLLEAAHAAEEILHSPDMASALLDRQIEQYPDAQDAAALHDAKDKILHRLDSRRTGLKRLRDRLGEPETAAKEFTGDRDKDDDAFRMLHLMLEIPEEREKAVGIIETLLDREICNWELVLAALVAVEEKGGATAFIEKAAALVTEHNRDKPEVVTFVEEATYVLKQVGPEKAKEAQGLFEKLYGVLLKVQPFNRDVIRYSSARAAETGNIESLVQFVERKIATSRPQERGKLYFELATYSDLTPQFHMRGPTFWKIAGTSLPDYPSVVFNNLEYQIENEDYAGAAALLMESTGQMPRYLYPELYELAAGLQLKADDTEGFNRTIRSTLHAVAWNERLITGLTARADEGSMDDQSIAALFAGLVRWHFLSPEIFPFARFVFELADEKPEMRADIVAIFRTCIDIPFPQEEDAPGRPEEISRFFDQQSRFLAEWGYGAEAVRCLERSILISTEPEQRLGFLVKLADIYKGMGPAGVEGLLLTISRIWKAGRPSVNVKDYLEFLATQYGIDLFDEEGLTDLLRRSAPTEDYKWMDIVLAGFAAWFTGDFKKGAVFAQRSLQKNPEFIESGLFAGLCYEKLERWRDAADFYQKVADRTSSESEILMLLKRAALILEVQLQRDTEALALLLRGLEVTPTDDNLFTEIKSKAVKQKDKQAFILAHEIVENHMPGRQTLRAFFYKYAKEMDEVFGDLESASKILLQAFSLAPRKGPVMDAIVRIALKMHRYEPASQAAVILRSGGASRDEISRFVISTVRRFLEQENMPSAYGLMNECIQWDPGLDVVKGVRLIAREGDAGVAIAKDILNTWITSLETAIGSKLEDSQYIKRIDTLSEMRDVIIETSKLSDEEEAEEEELPPLDDAYPRISIPPESLDKQWEDVAKAPLQTRREETTLDHYPPQQTVPAPSTAEALAEAEAKVAAEAAPDKVDFGPPSALTKEQEELLDAVALDLEDLPKVIIDLPDKELDAIRALSMVPAGMDAYDDDEDVQEAGSPSFPPALASVIIDSIGKTEDVEPKVIINVPGDREKERKAEDGDEPDEKPVEEEVEEEEEESVIIDHGAHEKTSVEVVIVSRTALEPEEAAADEEKHVVRGLGPAEEEARERREPIEEPAVEAEDEAAPPPLPALPPPLPPQPPPLPGTEEKPETQEYVEEPKIAAKAKREGDVAIERFAEKPWRLGMVSDLLERGPGNFSHRSSSYLLRGIFSTFDSEKAGYDIRKYQLIGKSGTAKKFASLVESDESARWLEVLQHLWEHAPSLTVERLTDYGVNVGDQITPFSSGPVAPVIERAIRAFGYIRASVYSKREKKMQIDVVRANPPAVVVLLPPGRIPMSFDFYMGKTMWGATAKRILAYTLPADEGKQIMEASVEAFGRLTKKEKIDPIVISIVQDMWQVIPPKVQDRLRGTIQAIEHVSFEDIRRTTTAECIRAGFLFSGDMMSAVRQLLPSDMLSSIENDIPRDLLSGVIKESEDMQQFIRFALSDKTLEFIDDFLV